MRTGGDFGGLRWARETGGNLTDAERRRMLGGLAEARAAAAARSAAGVGGGTPPAGLDVGRLAPPDSRWAREAEEACEELSAALRNHSYRAWAFARALAAADGAGPDPEALYVGALLHDAGLSSPVPKRCFTLAGAEAALEAARRAGVAEGRAERVADAICRHVDPGLSAEEDGSEAVYLAAGTLLDVVGARYADVGAGARERVVRRWPREGFKEEIVRRWDAESEAVPEGRAALLREHAAFATLVDRAPFSE